MDTLKWWKSKISDVDEVLNSVKKGKVSTLCKSAGGRDVKMVVYGEKHDLKHKANYSSACGAKDLNYYADKTGIPPIILLIGAIHAQELEGTMSLLNLINLIETGEDFRGSDICGLGGIIKDMNCRLIIIPIMNPDGRVRCEPDSMLGLKNDDLRHIGQGRWHDGTLCGWPGCKAVHPIKDSVSVLGAYFNDDGVNFMHDNFFLPMAEETKALLKLADEESPDYTILLHGGSNCTNVLLQPANVPQHIKESVHSLAERVAELSNRVGLKSYVEKINNDPKFPPPSFNLTSAIHHICGGVSITYESNQGLAESNMFHAEDILLHHYMLFEGILRESGAITD